MTVSLLVLYLENWRLRLNDRLPAEWSVHVCVLVVGTKNLRGFIEKAECMNKARV